MPATLHEKSAVSIASANTEIPIDSLGIAVGHLIALNRAIHARTYDGSGRDSVSYAREFGTIVVQSGMRTGKTYLAKKYAQDTSTYLITFANDPQALLQDLDSMQGLDGITTVVIDCWLADLLAFQVDARIQDAMRAATPAYQRGFTSIISYLSYRVQKAFGPTSLLLILG